MARAKVRIEMTVQGFSHPIIHSFSKPYLASSVGRALGFYVQMEPSGPGFKSLAGCFFFRIKIFILIFQHDIYSTVLHCLSTLSHNPPIHFDEERGIQSNLTLI